MRTDEYKIPRRLNDFQRELYIHLIEWKWRYITKEVGIYTVKNRAGKLIDYEFDAILPKSVHEKYPLIYPGILDDLLALKETFYFKLHEQFNHMASSQAANANLFLPILLNKKANDILPLLKSDFKSLAVEELYNGFRIEFWDGNSNAERGILNDHSAKAGTDSDIAIAYYNKNNELCLWLIEHKLTEPAFSTCGGFNSEWRDKTKHTCENSFSEIIDNKHLCHYHDVNRFEYWNITSENKGFFVNPPEYKSCPFKGGMNQLWRNQLMGLALEKQGKYKEVYFSVVHHPDNHHLDNSMKEYKQLINHNPKFSSFASKEVIDAASKVDDEAINNWIEWYKELYHLN